MTDRKDRTQHWDTVYRTKADQEVGWFQETPATSLELVMACASARSSPIIDIGGGNARLIKSLFDLGYQELTLLDISQNAIERSRSRFGMSGDQVNWIACDVTSFRSPNRYEVWHDRAAFHFLIEEDQIWRYAETAAQHIMPGGYLVVATFSPNGPETCSGLPVRRYSGQTLQKVFHGSFLLKKAFEQVHLTPSGTEQHFLWAVLRKVK